MKDIRSILFILALFFPTMLQADLIGNPGTQVGGKNLFVGLELSNNVHFYDLDTNDLKTSSDRISLKVTTGLNDWLDIFIKGGGASLMLDYKEESGAIKNFDSDFKAGFGGGTRVRLLNFVNSRTRVFFQGGGFFFKTNDDIQWNQSDGSILTREREIKWADFYCGLGVSKRMDYIDFTFGVGFSEIKWWIEDIDVTKSGVVETRVPLELKESLETVNPIFGFLGLDFVLPLEYRISLQAGIRNIDEYEFSVAVSQGLEKD